jgi:hypothetical protein
MPEDNGYKTGCVGILMPLALVAYGLVHIIGHYRRKRYEFWPRSEESIEWEGVAILAMALFVHAVGFVPYKRYPVIRWLLVSISIGVFFYALYLSAAT